MSGTPGEAAAGDRLEAIEGQIAECQRHGSPEVTFYGYVGYEDTLWLVRELRAERQRVAEMEGALHHVREGIGTLIHTQQILKSEMPYGSPSYSNEGHLEADVRIQAYNDTMRILDASQGAR